MISQNQTGIYQPFAGSAPTGIYQPFAGSAPIGIYQDPFRRTPTESIDNDTPQKPADRSWSPGKLTPPTPVGIGDRPPPQIMLPVQPPPPPPPPPPPQQFFMPPPASVPTIAAPAMPKEQLNNSMWTNVWGPKFGMWNQFNSEARNQAIQRTLGGGEF